MCMQYWELKHQLNIQQKAVKTYLYELIAESIDMKTWHAMIIFIQQIEPFQAEVAFRYQSLHVCHVKVSPHDATLLHETGSSVPKVHCTTLFHGVASVSSNVGYRDRVQNTTSCSQWHLVIYCLQFFFFHWARFIIIIF